MSSIHDSQQYIVVNYTFDGIYIFIWPRAYAPLSCYCDTLYDAQMVCYIATSK